MLQIKSYDKKTQNAQTSLTPTLKKYVYFHND